MQIQPNVTRISIPIDDLGMLAVKLDIESIDSNTKRKRKLRFKQGERLLRAIGVVEPKQTLHSISTGVNAAGDLVVELTVTNPAEEAA